MLARAQQPVRMSIEERMRKFDEWVKILGYRTPTRDDLKPGVELLMIEVERYMAHNQGYSFEAVSSTRVKLDDDPIAPSKAYPGKEVVYYHCIMPPWDGQCFVHVEVICASGYVEGCYTNDTRYVVKAR